MEIFYFSKTNRLIIPLLLSIRLLCEAFSLLIKKSASVYRSKTAGLRLAIPASQGGHDPAVFDLIIHLKIMLSAILCFKDYQLLLLS